MTEFSFLAIGISIILGIGVTMLLTSLVNVFTARRRIQFDWIPLTWAFYILAIQIQYYAATWGLNDRTEWTKMTFILPLLVASLIFLAASLVLPSSNSDFQTNIREYFEKDGKWAVAALAVRGGVAVCANAFVMRSVPYLFLL